MKIVLLKKQSLKRFLVVLLLLIGFGSLGNYYRCSSAPVSAQPGVPVPILMYHSICADTQKENKFVLSPKELEKDLKYLQENGFETILIEDLIAYTESNAPLPEKPVVLTFDDGYLNNKTNALPLLEKYHMCAVINVVGEFTDIFSDTEDLDPRYAHMTWDDIAELAETGYIEIGSHTYNLHHDGKRKGAKKKPNEGVEDYKNMLRRDLSALQQTLTEKSGVTPVTFAYPYGHVSEESLDIIRKVGFKASLSCYEKMNYITRDPSCLYLLGRYNRPSGISTQEFMKKALRDAQP